MIHIKETQKRVENNQLFPYLASDLKFENEQLTVLFRGDKAFKKILERLSFFNLAQDPTEGITLKSFKIENSNSRSKTLTFSGSMESLFIALTQIGAISKVTKESFFIQFIKKQDDLDYLKNVIFRDEKAKNLVNTNPELLKNVYDSVSKGMHIQNLNHGLSL